MYNLTIIIPTLNNISGLKYLQNYLYNKPYKVIVIDNKKKNLGFAGGVNKGAKDVRTKWMLILNDDIEFYEKMSNDKLQMTNKIQIANFRNNKNTIETLIKFAEEERLDAVSPILRNPDGKVENYGYRVMPIGRIQLFKLDSLDKLEELEKLDGLTAACLLVRADVFRKLGGFDEKFFAYLEDVDFFLRFKKAGYKMGMADVEVLHRHMTTSKTMGNFKARQDMINWWRLYFKHKEKFRFNIDFIVERLRNVAGYMKATLGLT